MTMTMRWALALVLAMTFLSPSALATEDRVPVLLEQDLPDYPFSLMLQGKSGDVIVQLTVELDGTVSHPAVVKSSHPDFEAPAVEATLKWRFKAATRDGKPVVSRINVTLHFQATNMGGGPRGYPMWHIPMSAPTSFPDRYQYDQPPKPLVTSAPVYPFELLQKKVRGAASMTFVIDPTGRPHMVKILSASQPEFGAATAAMIEAWSFEPSMKGGKPSWALLRIDQSFTKYGDAFPMNDSAVRILKDLDRSPCPIVKDARELDAVPKGRFQPQPSVPGAVIDAQKHVDAEIEFVIDHAGHAQLPRVVSASETSFGWAAATAVARWQFTAPTKAGRPVDTLARITLAYNPPAKTAGP